MFLIQMHGSGADTNYVCPLGIAKCLCCQSSQAHVVSFIHKVKFLFGFLPACLYLCTQLAGARTSSSASVTGADGPFPAQSVETAISYICEYKL